jgi:hypothetical protein
LGCFVLLIGVIHVMIDVCLMGSAVDLFDRCLYMVNMVNCNFHKLSLSNNGFF